MTRTDRLAAPSNAPGRKNPKPEHNKKSMSSSPAPSCATPSVSPDLDNAVVDKSVDKSLVGHFVYLEYAGKIKTNYSNDHYRDGEYIIVSHSPHNLIGVKSVPGYGGHETKAFPVVGEAAYRVVSSRFDEAALLEHIGGLSAFVESEQNKETRRWCGSVSDSAKSVIGQLRRALETVRTEKTKEAIHKMPDGGSGGFVGEPAQFSPSNAYLRELKRELDELKITHENTLAHCRNRWVELCQANAVIERQDGELKELHNALQVAREEVKEHSKAREIAEKAVEELASLPVQTIVDHFASIEILGKGQLAAASFCNTGSNPYPASSHQAQLWLFGFNAHTDKSQRDYLYLRDDESEKLIRNYSGVIVGQESEILALENTIADLTKQLIATLSPEAIETAYQSGFDWCHKKPGTRPEHSFDAALAKWWRKGFDAARNAILAEQHTESLKDAAAQLDELKREIKRLQEQAARDTLIFCGWGYSASLTDCPPSFSETFTDPKTGRKYPYKDAVRIQRDRDAAAMKAGAMKAGAGFSR